MFEAFAIYFVTINAMTFGVFAADKRAAQRRERRVPEARLLGLALMGGTPLALVAQQVLRHKTRKEPFRSRLWLIAGLQMLLLGAALVYRFR